MWFAFMSSGGGEACRHFLTILVEEHMVRDKIKGEQSMSIETQTSGSALAINANAILSVEIKGSTGCTRVCIDLAGEDRPRVIEFETRRHALEFYERLWQQRTETH